MRTLFVIISLVPELFHFVVHSSSFLAPSFPPKRENRVPPPQCTVPYRVLAQKPRELRQVRQRPSCRHFRATIIRKFFRPANFLLRRLFFTTSRTIIIIIDRRVPTGDFLFGCRAYASFRSRYGTFVGPALPYERAYRKRDVVLVRRTGYSNNNGTLRYGEIIFIKRSALVRLGGDLYAAFPRSFCTRHSR